MKKMHLISLFISLVVLMNTLQMNGQNTLSSKVEFLNAPVLFNEGGKSYQQVIASYRAERDGKIIFTKGGKELLRTNLRKGNNRFLLTVPAVKRHVKIIISAKIDDKPAEKYPVTLVPPKKWEIYFVQHTHTDIGFTRPQSEILAEHMRYLDYALDYCDKTDSFPDDSQFRWTCEAAWVVKEYLRCRPPSQIERLKDRIREGRIEVTAMPFNMIQISDENIMFDFLQCLRMFKEYGIPVQTAMQNDVTGIAWCMPDYLKATGVKYLTMGVNETRSIRPFDKPTCFWWESPSGARLLAFRADLYFTGNSFGLASKAIRAENLLWYLADLERKGYPFNRVAVQFCGYSTDNSPPSTAACDLVKQWNAKYEYPKLRLAVDNEFMKYVENNYGDKLSVYRQAWLEWWDDGAGSAPRETAVVRKVQNMEQEDEGLFAMVSMMGGELGEDLQQKITHISENALFFDEHTFGAAESISDPFCVNSMCQWLQKGAYAWEALKKVTLLNEDALGKIQKFFKKSSFPLIYVINPMGWDRSGVVQLFIYDEILPRNKVFSITDIATGERVPIQFLRGRREGAYWKLEVNDVPALGFKALKIEVTDQDKSESEIRSNENLEILENQYYRIVIDEKTGGIKEFYDKDLQEDLYDHQSPYFIGQPVRGTLPSRFKELLIGRVIGIDLKRKRIANEVKPSYTTVFNVKMDKGVMGDVWKSIKISADMEGFTKGIEGAPMGIQWEIRLYNNIKKVELIYQENKGKNIITSPEALYVAFPFRLPSSHIVFETIGGSLTQGEQLSGSSSDWNVAQNFVSIKGKKGQIIVVSDEVPLWQFSDFNMGKFERYPKPGKTWLYSWVMNNYWFTNFRAFQLGAFKWTYQITTSRDTTNNAATKFAWGTRNPFLTRTIPEGKDEFSHATFRTLELNGNSNAVLINTRPAFSSDGAILLHFREVDGQSAMLRLSSRIANRPIKSMKEVNIIGEEIREVHNPLSFRPFEVKFIEIQF